MKLDKNLSKAIDYTTMLFSDLGRLMILIVLDIIPIVNFVVLGYIGNVIKEPKDSKQLPPLTNFFDLWVQGLKILVASFIFMIIPIVLVGPFIFLFVVSWLPIQQLFPTISWVLAGSLLIVGILLAFFLAIILSMSIVNMLRKNRFGKAFAFGEILSTVGKIGWGTYILWLIVIFVCSIIVAGIGGLPVIGWLLSLIIAPLFGVFVGRSAALAYIEGTDTHETPLPSEEA